MLHRPAFHAKSCTLLDSPVSEIGFGGNVMIGSRKDFLEFVYLMAYYWLHPMYYAISMGPYNFLHCSFRWFSTSFPLIKSLNAFGNIYVNILSPTIFMLKPHLVPFCDKISTAFFWLSKLKVWNTRKGYDSLTSWLLILAQQSML